LSVIRQSSNFLHIQLVHRMRSGYILRGSDQCARASKHVQAIGVFVTYMTATG